MDILSIVYERMIADDYISNQTYDDSLEDYRIKYYDYPETGDVTHPFIIIDPLDDGDPVDFADNTWTKLDFLLQIDVWTPSRAITLALGNRVRDLMWDEFGFKQIKGPNEHNKGIYRKADRYRGTLYRSDFDNL